MSEAAVPIRPGRGVTVIPAILLNLALFSVGLYFELHPRDRQDVWSAAGVASVAIVNSAALTLPPGRPVGSRLVSRLRRIALVANGLLLPAALLVVVVETFRDWQHATLYGVALVLPPLLTIGAVRRLPPVA